MKNIILLLLLPLLCSSQTINLNDTTYNITLQVDSFSGVFTDELTKGIGIVSMSNTYNIIMVDTVDNVVVVSRNSKVSLDGDRLTMEIISIEVGELYGTTYNLYDYYNGSYGFLFMKKDGTIIFSLQDISFINEYYGFIGFIN